MATIKTTKCDDCNKKDCEQRIKGSVCSLNSQLSPLIASVKSRDPILVSRFIVSIVGSEYERYEKAKQVEDIGGTSVKTITHKDGREYDVEMTKTIDNNVTNLAMNIIKAGKMLNEILNPPKNVPMFQQNIMNNFGANVADEIRNLNSTEREKQLKFIDDKLDVKRES